MVEPQRAFKLNYKQNKKKLKNFDKKVDNASLSVINLESIEGV